MDFLIATGVVFLGSTFIYYFLYKLHMRGINTPDFSSHRHPDNLRRKRREVVEFDTMEILKPSEYDWHPVPVDFDVKTFKA